MPDATLRIELVDDGQRPQSSPVANPPLGPGPPPAQVAGASSSPWRQPAPRQQPSAGKPDDFAAAASSLAARLATQMGMGGAANRVQQVAGIASGFVRLANASVAATAVPMVSPTAAGAAPAVPIGVPAAAGSGSAAPAVAGTAGGGVMASLAASAGPVGIAVAAVATGAVALGVAIKLMTGVFRSEAEKIQGYSFASALAIAQSDLRKEMSLMHRAEQIGPQAAKWETAGSKFDNSLDRLGTQILKSMDRLGQPLLDLLIVMTAAAEKSEKAWKWFEESPVKVDWIAMFGPLGVALKSSLWLLKEIAKSVQKEEKDPFTDQFLDAFMNQPLTGFGPGIVPRPPIPFGNPGGPLGPMAPQPVQPVG